MTNFTSNSTSIAVIIDNSCPILGLSLIVRSYMITIVSVIGIVVNTWCVVVFSMIIHKEKLSNHMFKYLLLKALHVDVQFLVQVFAPLYYCTTCSTYQTYASQFWYIWFYYYVECINELCSGFYDVAATFDCLITINQKFDCCRKNLSFYIISTGVFIFPVLY
jgi:hypothetical protein